MHGYEHVYSFQQESLAGVKDEVQALLQAHYDEIAHFQDIPLAPDWDRYAAAEANDILKIFTIRRDGELVGYEAMFVAPNMHYSDSVQAVQDVLFLKKEYRGHRVGLNFMNWCDNQLREWGVEAVMQHTKKRPDLYLGPILKHIGYEPMDEIWVRRLNERKL